MISLDELLARSAAHHGHLCPRQVLGVRMGMLAAELLQLELPQSDKRLLTFVETDGCFADGVAVATNCWVGRRTLRVMDWGKIAATFADTRSERAFRLHPHPCARERAGSLAPEAVNRWETYLLGYQRMADDDLLVTQPVSLVQPIERSLSRPELRAMCQACGEEIINERELIRRAGVLCRSCAGDAYYQVLPAFPPVTLAGSIELRSAELGIGARHEDHAGILG